MIARVPADGDYGRPALADRRAIDWAGHRHDTLINGRNVHYVEIGEGPSGFVLMHGLGGCWQHWSQTLALLARHGRAIALDLPGFGASQMPASRITLELLADTAAALARHRGLERVSIIGHSMGGPIAVRLARRHPELARALILVAGATYTFSQILAGRRLARSARRQPRETAAILTEALTCAVPLPDAVKRAIAQHSALRALALWPYLHRPDAFAAEQTSLLLAGAGARGARQTVRAIGRATPFEGLAEIKLPILSLGGQHDLIVPPADLATFARAAPHASSVLIEDAAHMVMLERPRALNAQIERFLANGCVQER